MANRVVGKTHPACFDNQEYCSDCLEFQKRWSSKASEVATLKGVSLMLGDRAGILFIAGEDVLAMEARNLMREVDRRQQEGSKVLERDFISVAHPGLSKREE